MKICFIVGAFQTMKCGVGDYSYNFIKAIAKKLLKVYKSYKQK